MFLLRSQLKPKNAENKLKCLQLISSTHSLFQRNGNHPGEHDGVSKPGSKNWKERQCPWPPRLVDVHGRVFFGLPLCIKFLRSQRKGLDLL